MTRRLGILLVSCAAVVLALSACSKADSAEPGTTGTRAAGLPRLVDLGADKCIPCRMMAPVLEELSAEYAGTMEVEFIDVWKERDKGAKYGVRMIPTQIFYDPSGKELLRHSGFIGKEDILTTWRDLGYDFGQVGAR